MIRPWRYIQNLIIILLVSDFQFLAFSQSDSLTQGSKKFTSKSDSICPIHSLYSGVGLGSNIIFLGSTISQDKPFYSAAITYGYKNNLYASVSASHIIDINPYLAFYSLSFNYSHAFNSWFDISSSIAGYKTPESLQEKLFNDFAFINVTTGFDWKFLYTKLSFGELFSDGTRGYIQIRNSRYFETSEFFKGKGQVSFDPNFNILLGDRVKIVTITGTTKYGSSVPFHHFNKKNSTTIKSYSHKFGLVDFEFSMPVTFSYNNFSVEAEPSYLFPAFTSTEYPSPKGFTFFLNAYFRIL